jgi:hypothetical protein
MKQQSFVCVVNQKLPHLKGNRRSNNYVENSCELWYDNDVSLSNRELAGLKGGPSLC